MAPPPRSLWAAAARVGVPALVVWGELDRLVGVHRAARTAATLPAGRLLRLEGVGHVAQIERPEVVARGVEGLLDAAADGSWPAVVPDAESDHERARAPRGVTRSGRSAYGTVPV